MNRRKYTVVLFRKALLSISLCRDKYFFNANIYMRTNTKRKSVDIQIR